MKLSPRSSALTSRWSIVFLVSLVVFSGCGWKDPNLVPKEKLIRDASADVNLSAVDVLAAAKRAVASPPLSLSVASENGNSFQTSWQGPLRGDLHIVRYWKERTRYRVTVAPDIADPIHRSRITVTDETQEQPSDPQPWYPAPDTHRPERSEAVLQHILAQIPKQPTTMP